MKRKGAPPSRSTEAGAARKLARGKANHKDKPAIAEVARGTTRAGKKASIFWDSDGVDGGKSSLRVVLDWMTNTANYDKWCGSDRHNGNTKEALLKQIVQQLVDVGIKHCDSAGVREKINSIEKQYREAEDFLAATGAGITDEKDLRAAVLKRCPYYYDLQDVMMDRPSSRPKVTSDDINAMEAVEPERDSVIMRRGLGRPLAVQPPPLGSTANADSVEALQNQQANVLRARQEQREALMAFREREHELKQKEMQLKDEKNAREREQADVELELKKIELKTAQRESTVQLLLSRKQLKDSGIGQEEIDRLLPLPA